MTSREQFEAWAITSAWLGVGDEAEMDRDADGAGYNEIEVHTAWLAWQASRESLVVELPSGSVTSDGQGISLDGFRVIDAMKTAGVKCEVKS